MKANEAPEKIYLYPSDRCGEEYEAEWGDKPWGEDYVEYTRTDVFIEKAEDFIRREICDYIVHYNYGPNNDMETMYVDNRFFEDFKNYIEE